MKHETSEQLIQKSLDFEINDRESRLLHEHLATCPECRRLYEALQQVRESIGMLNEVYPSIDFNTRVMQALGPKARRVGKKATLALGSIWIASLAGLFVVPYRAVFARLLTSVPAMVRFVDMIRVAMTTIGHVIAPLAKLPVDPVYPVLGVAMSFTMFLILSKVMHKEEQCKA